VVDLPRVVRGEVAEGIVRERREVNDRIEPRQLRGGDVA